MSEVLKRVGRYDLMEVVGRGGAAVVYLATQRDLQRDVALKELAPYLSADTSFAERFVDESRLAGSMNHPNVVTVHEFFEDAGTPYIAMEYLPYGSLRQYIGRLTIAQIAGVLEGVLAGLSHGETHGIVHRDLKPENLLVAIDGRAKIADFGVARAYNQAVTRAVATMAGTTIGTPAYMSPEQALGSDLTPATDLYSLGIVAWEMLTGTVPFEDTDTPVAVLYRQVHEQIPSVRTIAPEVDPAIAAWLERMLEKKPEQRFQNAQESWEVLEDIVLELLGPRWRRDARLVVDQLPRVGRTLTPAAFGKPGSAVLTPPPDGTDTPAPGESSPPEELPAGGAAFTVDDARVAERHLIDPDTPVPDAAPEELQEQARAWRDSVDRLPRVVPETIGELPAGRTGRAPAPGEIPVTEDAPAAGGAEIPGAAQTIAPARRRHRSTTQFKIARRHRDEPEPESALKQATRGRGAAIGVVTAMIVAAVLGVVIASATSSSSKPKTSTAPTPAERQHNKLVAERNAAIARNSAIDTANGKLRPIVTKFAETHNATVSALLNAKTPANQAKYARQASQGEKTAATQVGQFDDKTPVAKPIATAMTALASDYAKLATAVESKSKTKLKQARATVEAGERTLQKAVKAL